MIGLGWEAVFIFCYKGRRYKRKDNGDFNARRLDSCRSIVTG